MRAAALLLLVACAKPQLAQTDAGIVLRPGERIGFDGFGFVPGVPESGTRRPPAAIVQDVDRLLEVRETANAQSAWWVDAAGCIFAIGDDGKAVRVGCLPKRAAKVTAGVGSYWRDMDAALKNLADFDRANPGLLSAPDGGR